MVNRGKWFYSGKKMQDGTPITIQAIDATQDAEYFKKGLQEYVPVVEVKPKEIDWLTVTTKETTKKLCSDKAKSLGIKIVAKDKEQDILDAIQSKLKEVE